MTFLFYFAFLILSYRRNLRKIFKFGFNCCLSFFALYVRFACVIIHKIIRNVCILCMIVTSSTGACYAEIANIFGSKTNVILYQEVLWIVENI